MRRCRSPTCWWLRPRRRAAHRAPTTTRTASLPSRRSASPPSQVRERSRMIEYADAFPSLGFDRPEDGILVITLSAAGRLNAVNATMHGELAAVWPVIDKEPHTPAVRHRR